MKKIVVIGEILVEFMADLVGEGFDAPQPLTGPFPSGAPAIFADQAAKLGQPVGIISAVGDDDFGRVNLARLERDGVDVSGVHIDTDRPTGSAFVRYRADGSRDFVFNIRHSASGAIAPTAFSDALIKSADHLHVMGSALSSPALAAMVLDALGRIRARGGTVSFDPNLRKELLSAPGMRDALEEVLAQTDLFLPSDEEIFLVSDATDPNTAARELIDRGIRTIVVKQGADGATSYDAASTCGVPAFAVEEVDPTGAGDAFGAAYVTFWLRGLPHWDALNLASAAGALAVGKRGPMEGTSTQAELEAFLNRQNSVRLP